MRKIPTLFKRDPENMRYVTDEVDPRCEWVLRGEGTATRKYDGTCVMRDENGSWWARREVKPGKTPPPNYMPVEKDEVTGKTVGWEPVEQSPFIKAFSEAREHLVNPRPETYELCGPKVQGNPEGFDIHTLIPHSSAEEVWFPLEPGAELIRHTVANLEFEGVVWHHPDGRMAKLKVRDLPEER